MLLGGFVLYIGLRLGCVSQVVAWSASVASDVGLSVCGVVLCGSLCLWCRLCVSSGLWCRPLCLLLPCVWLWLHLCFWLNGCHSALFPASGLCHEDGLGAKVRGDILGRGFLQCFFFNIHHIDPPNPAPYCIFVFNAC